MSPDPMPFERVTNGQRIETTPQILILDGLIARCFPAASLPTMNPDADTFLYVLRIGIDPRFDRLPESFQGLNDGTQLHAIVGRRRLTSEQLRFSALPAQYDAPTANSGIPAAGTVSVDLNALHCFMLRLRAEGSLRSMTAFTVLRPLECSLNQPTICRNW